VAIEFNDETPMPFGKHAGVPLRKVPASYLIWCSETIEPTDDVRRALLTYIAENANVIESELEDSPRYGEED
jgi:uncharacterized protein (DUF3820 family)